MKTKIKNKLVYFLNNSMYINITNLCTNNCVFCIKNLSNNVGGIDLRIKDENISSEQIISEIKNNFPETRSEIVFCGYGEPLIKLEIIKNTAKFIKKNYPNIPVRVNTNGQANLIHKKNIAPELAGLIDKISVSLNADNANLYEELTRCKFDKEQAFEAVKNFIAECQKQGIETTATIVVGFENYKINIEKCKEITENLGVKFKIREWLRTGYE
ncbi:MAG: TatD family nuclease-associated radical SAM protein [bacterium]